LRNEQAWVFSMPLANERSYSTLAQIKRLLLREIMLLTFVRCAL